LFLVKEMPIYDFMCKKCDIIFEKMVATGASASCTCGNQAEKLVGLSDFRLEGSGWYSDGYGSESKA
jgi:putative FmdB family regulatory protein